MMDRPVWSLSPSHDLKQKREQSMRARPCRDYPEALAYIDDPFAYQQFRPVLHVETVILPTSVVDRYPENGPLDFQQIQRGYPESFRNSIPVLQGASTETQPFDDQEMVWRDCLSSPSLQSASTYSSPMEGTIVPPRATRQSSFSPTQTPSDYVDIRLLEIMTPESPEFDAELFGEQYHFPTIVDRVQKLSLHSMRLFKGCGSDPNIQSAVLDILESPEIHVNAPITSEMAAPLLEKIEYVNKTHGKGKRGAPQFYKCLWGSCGEKMSRKLHALEHIMNHVDNRSHVCDHCGKGFVRKNELKKHSPCKASKRSLRCVNRGPIPMHLNNYDRTSFPHSSNTAAEPYLHTEKSWNPWNSTELGSLYHFEEPTQTAHQLSGTVRPRRSPHNVNILTIDSWNPQISV